jgi:hypothetical protein
MLATGDTDTTERRDDVATLTRAQELNAKWRHLRGGHAADDGHAVHASADDGDCADESEGGEARVLPAAAGRLEVAGRIATMETRLARLAGELSTCVVARRSPPASPTRSRPPLIDAGTLNKNTPHHVSTLGADAIVPSSLLAPSPLRVDQLHVHGQEQHRDVHLTQTYSSPRSSAGGSVRVALFEANPAAAWTVRGAAYMNDRGRGGTGVADAGGSGDSGVGSRARTLLHARLRDDIADIAQTSEDRRRRGGARGGVNAQVTSATTAPPWTSLPRSSPQYAFPGSGDTYEYHHHHHHGQGHSVSPPLSPRSPRSPQRYVSVPLPSPLANDRLRHTRTTAPEDVQFRWESEPPAAADDPRCGEEGGERG